MPKALTADGIDQLYLDPQKCAALVGLSYAEASGGGFSRKRSGKGFRFFDDTDSPITDKQIKKRLTELVIPPAWQEVWICPAPNGHLLVTGKDDKGRKQYIYHPKWRQIRDLLKFYRLIMFGKALPEIRKTIDEHLERTGLDYHRVLAGMLWILDNTYIRVGNDIYYSQNDSMGLTTLNDQNVIIMGSVVTLTFPGKSGKHQTITFDQPAVAKLVKDCRDIKGERLFQFLTQEGDHRPVIAQDINAYLHEITSQTISAKDFRTWGGTLMAFHHLIEEKDADKKAAKIAVEAVDTAAGVLGNTRSIARSSYVHPHVLKSFTNGDFEQYYQKLKPARSTFLDKREKELLQFLEFLFKEEFDLLRTN